MIELARRYVVMPLATEAPFDPADPDGVFVLKPWKDPAALSALRAYRDRCFPELRRDLDAWIRAIESGPSMRGDVGRRNEPFARAGASKRTATSQASTAAPVARTPKSPIVRKKKPRAAVKTPVATTGGAAPARRTTGRPARRRTTKKPAGKRRSR